MGITKRLASGIATCALALTLGAAAASAATITYTVTTGMQAGAWTTTLAIPRFNTSLGTLQSIDFALAGELLGTVNLTNSSGFASGGISSSIDLASLGLSANPSASFSGTSGVTSPPLSGSASGSTTITGAALIPYLGPGPDVIVGITGSGQCTADSGSTVAACDVSSSGTLSISQNYVPEPATLAIIGIGLAALGAGARRRRKS